MAGKSDIPNRLRYLVSQEGGVRAAARSINIPYSTYRRLLTGENEPTSLNRDRINRRFRREAPADVKNREKKTGDAGFALVDEATARKLITSYRRQGLNVRVYARKDFRVNDNGTIVKKTSYGQGTDVSSAKGTLDVAFDNYADSYPLVGVTDEEEAKYRVIPLIGGIA